MERHGMNPLMRAAESGNLGLVYRNFAYIGRQNFNGKTALIYAIEANRIEVVRLLAPYEFNIKVGSRKPIDFAKLTNNNEIIKILKDVQDTEMNRLINEATKSINKTFRQMKLINIELERYTRY